MTLLHPPLRLTNAIPAFSFDVTPLLPPRWQEQIRQCSAQHSHWRVLDGISVTSREAQFRDTAAPKVGVVSGDVIAKELLWLNGLYRKDFLTLANSIGATEYEVCSDRRAGVNINATPRDARYEWHVDSNPLTGLLFVTSHDPSEGGQLVFRPDPVSRPDEDWELRVSPYAGTLLLFDARESAHVVTRLHADLRLSVPMNYYIAGHHERPEDLDGYLYE
jgi:hypothetical protein